MDNERDKIIKTILEAPLETDEDYAALGDLVDGLDEDPPQEVSDLAN